MNLIDILLEEESFDLQEKKKLTYDAKFDWIAKNMGQWLSDEIFPNYKMVETIPFFEKYKQYLLYKTQVNRNNPEAVLNSLPVHYADFLNIMDEKSSEDVVDEIKKQYPNITQKIARYERKEANPNETRGRKAKPKSPETFYTINGKRIDISKYKPLSSVMSVASEPEMVNEPVMNEPEIFEPKMPAADTPAAKSMRGRPRVESEFSPQERFMFKKQGVEYIKHLEDKFTEYNNLADAYIRRAQEKLNDIEKRRRFFGISDENPAGEMVNEPLNESIENIKANFRRFL